MLGSVQRPAKHCKAIKRAQPGAKDGVYFLKRSKAPYPSWCDMKTKGGGWTMVLTIDGRKGTFAYDSPLWTNKKTLNAKVFKAVLEVILDVSENKLDVPEVRHRAPELMQQLKDAILSAMAERKRLLQRALSWPQIQSLLRRLPQRACPLRVMVVRVAGQIY